MSFARHYLLSQRNGTVVWAWEMENRKDELPQGAIAPTIAPSICGLTIIISISGNVCIAIIIIASNIEDIKIYMFIQLEMKSQLVATITILTLFQQSFVYCTNKGKQGCYLFEYF